MGDQKREERFWPATVTRSPGSSSRLVDTLAASEEKVRRAIRAARAGVRRCVWRLAGREAPDAGGTVTVDLDGVLVIAHSDKEDAAPTWKRTYGHHPTTR